MTKMTKTKIEARRKTQNAKRKVQNTVRKLSNAQLEAQVAELEEKIAQLTGDGRLQASDFRLQTSGRSLDTNPEVRSPKPEARVGITFPVPELQGVFAVGPNAVSVHWGQVHGVGSYNLRITSDPEGAVTVRSMTLPTYTVATTVISLEPGTTYWVSVRSVAQSGADDVSSAYAVTQAVTTPESAPTGDVGDLQGWLVLEQLLFQNVAGRVPQLETTELSPAQRRRLNGSGVRRYGFIEKVYEVSKDYPQFWPPFGKGRDDIGQSVQEIDVLRNLLIWFRRAARIIQDMLLLAGDDAFRVANAYYNLAREGTKQHHSDAVQVYEMLRLFWKKRRRRANEGEPTERKLLRDVRAVLHGNKDGFVGVQHESPTVSGGVHEVIDDVR